MRGYRLSGTAVLILVAAALIVVAMGQRACAEYRAAEAEALLADAERQREDAERRARLRARADEERERRQIQELENARLRQLLERARRDREAVEAEVAEIPEDAPCEDQLGGCRRLVDAMRGERIQLEGLAKGLRTELEACDGQLEACNAGLEEAEARVDELRGLVLDAERAPRRRWWRRLPLGCAGGASGLATPAGEAHVGIGATCGITFWKP